MAHKIILFFILILFFSFISVAVHAQNITADSLNNIKEKTDNLKNIKNLPSAEDIGLIASTIRNAAETYRSIKLKIINAVDYFQNIIKSIIKIWKKIKNSGIEIKNYIENKTDFISKKYSINLSLENFSALKSANLS